jgi:hypothetical protein
MLGRFDNIDALGSWRRRVNPRNMFVVHGRNHQAKKEVEDFL